MAGKEFRLVWGAAALVSFYVIANVVWRTNEPSLNPPSPEIHALIQRGQQVAEQCAACHYMDQRANFVGPYLVGVLGRPVASVPGYHYSNGLRQIEGYWTSTRLRAFLKAPQAFAPGTNMAVMGWPDQDIEAVLAYLQSKE